MPKIQITTDWTPEQIHFLLSLLDGLYQQIEHQYTNKLAQTYEQSAQETARSENPTDQYDEDFDEDQPF